MTDQELKDLVASLAVSSKETDQRLQDFVRERERAAEEADRRAAEAAEDSRLLKKRVDELGKQIGGLGNKFGSFTEGLMLPSVHRLLEEKFGVDSFLMRVRTKKNGRWFELDGFGYVNGTNNIGFIVEVKSHLDEESIAQTKRIMEEFGTFYPQYRGMVLHGVIATVDTGTEELRRKVADAGLYLVSVADEIAHFETDDDFVAKTVVA
jgi:hypothetical protein